MTLGLGLADTAASGGRRFAAAAGNLLTFPEAFDNAAWSKAATTVTANATAAPDGSQTADLVLDTAASSVHQIFQGASVTNALPYVYSIYAAMAGRRYLAIATPASFGGGFVEYDLQAGTVTRDAAAITAGLSASCAAVGGGWFRCVVSGTASATTSAVFGLRLRLVSGTSTYLGDGASGLALWRAEMVQG